MHRNLWRVSVVWGLVFGVEVMARLRFDTFAPPSPNGYGPRSAMTTWLAVATFLVVGLLAGFLTRRASSGPIAAVIASLVGYALGIVLTVVLFLTVILYDVTMLRTFEMTGGFDETFFLPILLLPIIAGLGFVGGMVGVGLGSPSSGGLPTIGRT